MDINAGTLKFDVAVNASGVIKFKKELERELSLKIGGLEKLSEIGKHLDAIPVTKVNGLVKSLNALSEVRFTGFNKSFGAVITKLHELTKAEQELVKITEAFGKLNNASGVVSTKEIRTAGSVVNDLRSQFTVLNETIKMERLAQETRATSFVEYHKGANLIIEDLQKIQKAARNASNVNLEASAIKLESDIRKAVAINQSAAIEYEKILHRIKTATSEISLGNKPIAELNALKTELNAIKTSLAGLPKDLIATQTTANIDKSLAGIEKMIAATSTETQRVEQLTAQFTNLKSVLESIKADVALAKSNNTLPVYDMTFANRMKDTLKQLDQLRLTALNENFISLANDIKLVETNAHKANVGINKLSLSAGLDYAKREIQELSKQYSTIVSQSQSYNEVLAKTTSLYNQLDKAKQALKLLITEAGQDDKKVASINREISAIEKLQKTRENLIKTELANLANETKVIKTNSVTQDYSQQKRALEELALKFRAVAHEANRLGDMESFNKANLAVNRLAESLEKLNIKNNANSFDVIKFSATQLKHEIAQLIRLSTDYTTAQSNEAQITARLAQARATLANLNQNATLPQQKAISSELASLNALEASFTRLLKGAEYAATFSREIKILQAYVASMNSQLSGIVDFKVSDASVLRLKQSLLDTSKAAVTLDNSISESLRGAPNNSQLVTSLRDVKAIIANINGLAKQIDTNVISGEVKKLEKEFTNLRGLFKAERIAGDTSAFSNYTDKLKRLYDEVSKFRTRIDGNNNLKLTDNLSITASQRELAKIEALIANIKNSSKQVGFDLGANSAKEFVGQLERAKVVLAEFEKLKYKAQISGAGLTKNDITRFTEFKRELSDLVTKLESVNNKTAATTSTITKLRAGVVDITERLNKGSTSLIRFSGSVAASKAAIGLLNDAIFRISPSLGVFTNYVQQNTGGLGSWLRAVAPVLIAGSALVATYRAATVGVREFAKSENELADISKISGIDGEELKQFFNEIQGLARVIPQTTSELNEMGKVAASLGIKGAANLSRFVESLSKLSSATDVQGAQGAQMLAEFLNVTGTNFDEMGTKAFKVANVLNALENDLNATAQGILATTTYTGQLSAAFNISQEDILGFSAAMRSIGIRPESGGSASTRVLEDVQRAAYNGGKELENFAKIAEISQEEFERLGKASPLDAFELLLGGMKRLQAQGVSLVPVLDTLGVQEIRERRTILQLVGGYEQLTLARGIARREALNQLSLDREVERKAKTLHSLWIRSSSVAKELAYAIGGLLAPSLKLALRGFLGLADAMSPSMRMQRELNDIIERNNVTMDISRTRAFYMADAMAQVNNAITQDGLIRSIQSMANTLKVDLVAGYEAAARAAIASAKTQAEAQKALFEVNKYYSLKSMIADRAQVVGQIADAQAKKFSYQQSGRTIIASADGNSLNAESGGYIYQDEINQVDEMSAMLRSRVQQMDSEIQSLRDTATISEAMDKLNNISGSVALNLDAESPIASIADESSKAAKEVKTVATVMQDLYNSLADIDRLAESGKVLGDFDVGAEKIEVARKALEELVQEFDLSTSSGQVKEVIALLTELGAGSKAVSEIANANLERIRNEMEVGLSFEDALNELGSQELLLTETLEGVSEQARQEVIEALIATRQEIDTINNEIETRMQEAVTKEFDLAGKNLEKLQAYLDLADSKNAVIDFDAIERNLEVMKQSLLDKLKGFSVTNEQDRLRLIAINNALGETQSKLDAIRTKRFEDRKNLVEFQLDNNNDAGKIAIITATIATYKRELEALRGKSLLTNEDLSLISTYKGEIESLTGELKELEFKPLESLNRQFEKTNNIESYRALLAKVEAEKRRLSLTQFYDSDELIELDELIEKINSKIQDKEFELSESFEIEADKLDATNGKLSDYQNLLARAIAEKDRLTNTPYANEDEFAKVLDLVTTLQDKVKELSFSDMESLVKQYDKLKTKSTDTAAYRNIFDQLTNLSRNLELAGYGASEEFTELSELIEQVSEDIANLAGVRFDKLNNQTSSIVSVMEKFKVGSADANLAYTKLLDISAQMGIELKLMAEQGLTFWNSPDYANALAAYTDLQNKIHELSDTDFRLLEQAVNRAFANFNNGKIEFDTSGYLDNVNQQISTLEAKPNRNEIDESKLTELYGLRKQLQEHVVAKQNEVLDNFAKRLANTLDSKDTISNQLSTLANLQGELESLNLGNIFDNTVLETYQDTLIGIREAILNLKGITETDLAIQRIFQGASSANAQTIASLIQQDPYSSVTEKPEILAKALEIYQPKDIFEDINTNGFDLEYIKTLQSNLPSASDEFNRMANEIDRLNNLSAETKLALINSGIGITDYASSLGNTIPRLERLISVTTDVDKVNEMKFKLAELTAEYHSLLEASNPRNDVVVESASRVDDILSLSKSRVDSAKAIDESNRTLGIDPESRLEDSYKREIQLLSSYYGKLDKNSDAYTSLITVISEYSTALRELNKVEIGTIGFNENNFESLKQQLELAKMLPQEIVELQGVGFNVPTERNAIHQLLDFIDENLSSAGNRAYELIALKTDLKTRLKEILEPELEELPSIDYYTEPIGYYNEMLEMRRNNYQKADDLGIPKEPTLLNDANISLSAKLGEATSDRNIQAVLELSAAIQLLEADLKRLNTAINPETFSDGLSKEGIGGVIERELENVSYQNTFKGDNRQAILQAIELFESIKTRAVGNDEVANELRIAINGLVDDLLAQDDVDLDLTNTKDILNRELAFLDELTSQFAGNSEVVGMIQEAREKLQLELIENAKGKVSSEKNRLDAGLSENYFNVAYEQLDYLKSLYTAFRGNSDITNAIDLAIAAIQNELKAYDLETSVPKYGDLEDLGEINDLTPNRSPNKIIDLLNEQRQDLDYNEQLTEIAKATEKFGETFYEAMNRYYEKLASYRNLVNEQAMNAKLQYGDGSEQFNNLRIQVEQLNLELIKTRDELEAISNLDDGRTLADIVAGVDMQGREDPNIAPIRRIISGAQIVGESFGGNVTDAAKNLNGFASGIEKAFKSFSNMNQTNKLLANGQTIGVNGEDLQQLSFDQMVEGIESLTSALKMLDTGLTAIFGDAPTSAGNKAVELGGTLVGVVGAALTGIPQLVELGTFMGKIWSRVIGDMRHGQAEVDSQVKEIGKSYKNLTIDSLRYLKVTKEVTRGGLLGLSGDTFTALDEERTKKMFDRAASLGESFSASLTSSIIDFANNSNEWSKNLTLSIKEALLKGIVQAFVEKSIIGGAMQQFIAEFTKKLDTEGEESAINYATSESGKLLSELERRTRILGTALKSSILSSGADAPSANLPSPTLIAQMPQAALINSNQLLTTQFGIAVTEFGTAVGRFKDIVKGKSLASDVR